MDSRSVSDLNPGPSVQISPDSIVDALQALKEVKGSTLTSIKKYFRSKYPHSLSDADIWRQVKLAIGKGLVENKIVKSGRKIALDFGGDQDGSKRRRRRKGDDEDDDSRRGRKRRSSHSRRRRRKRRRRSRHRRSRSKKRSSRRRGTRKSKRSRSRRRASQRMRRVRRKSQRRRRR